MLFLCSCTKRLPESEFLSYYEEHCKTKMSQGGITFYAMPLSVDYERVKWGNPLDSGFRVIFNAYPRTDLIFENAFLITKKDTSAVVLYRKIKTYELGNSDSFMFVFSEKKENAKIFVNNINNRIGNIEIDLKNCNNIRLIEN